LFGPVAEILMAFRGINPEQSNAIRASFFKHGDGITVGCGHHLSNYYIKGTCGFDDGIVSVPVNIDDQGVIGWDRCRRVR
jgi:hypothetical protein